MRKFIIKTFVFLSLSVVLITFLMIKIGNNWSKNSHEINVVLAYERLDSLKDCNKVIIIAGSNGCFSFDSSVISDSMHMPVVNTSTHAGIGVRMQFEMYKELIKKDDIVIFCPEYYSGISRLYGEVALFRILSTHMPSAYRKMSLAQWYNTFKYIGTHFENAIKVVNCQQFEGPYSASSVNEYGDIECEREHQSFGVYKLKGEMDLETLAYYQYIHDYSKNNGFTLIYLPPVLAESAFLNQKEQIDSLELFMNRNNIPFHVKPERYSFPDSLFFDTPYHMTLSGAKKRTLYVVEDMKRFIKK